jgi:hypothetical protein
MINLRLAVVGIWILLTAASVAVAQDKSASARASAAYAEVLLRKTEALADAEAIAAEHTADSPRMVDLRYEIAGLDRYLAKILAVSSADAPKLTLALGKLIVRRMALDVEAARLARTQNADHPDLKRAKRRLEIFDAAIKEILP